MEQPCTEAIVTDPVVKAAQILMGVNYLYPYQRLVIANLLDAAKSAGLEITYPETEPNLALVTDSELSRLGVTHNRLNPETDEDQDLTESPALGKQIVILPTGAGKSLCFQLPALMLKRPTLVLYPILSLMADQYRRLNDRGFTPALLRGGQSPSERQTIFNRIKAGDCRFIIANPEVLLTDKLLGRLPELNIGHFVVDEAHCVAEWGESFRPSYLQIAEILKSTGAPLATAFTATASPAILSKIRQYVFGPDGARSVLGNPDRPNISYRAYGAILRDRAVADLLQSQPRPAIVFCSSRARTEALARILRLTLGHKDIWFYHAGLSRDEKTKIEGWFFKSKTGILTATCAYGMGVDKADIRTVIHRDCPSSVEAYLQESGRAGRDGSKAEAILLWGPEDEARKIRLASALRAEVESVSDSLATRRAADDLRRFSRLSAYARNTNHCRREVLLAMLGVNSEWCSGCDVCQGTARPTLREEAAVTDFISRNRRRFSVNEAARYISKAYGQGWESSEVVRVLRYFISQNKLKELKFPFKTKLSLRR